MPSKLLSVTEKQDIYILGNACELTEAECTHMGITDDYTSISFYADKEIVAHIETVGFLYIFTKAQFEAAKDKIIDDEMYIEHSGLESETGLPQRGPYVDDYCVILPDFEGDIYASIYEESTGKCYLNNYDVTEDCYLFEHRDDTYEDDMDTEELIRLPANTKVIKGPIYTAIDHINKATYLDTAPDIDDVEGVYKVLSDYDSSNYQSVNGDFCDHLVYKPVFFGFMLGYAFPKAVNQIGNKYMNIYKAGGTRSINAGMMRPVFFSDIKKDLELIHVDFNKLLAEFICASDIYTARFNEWYKPLTRPLDRPIDA